MLGEVAVLVHTSLAVEAMQGGGAIDGVGNYNRTTSGETKGVHRSLRQGCQLLGLIFIYHYVLMTTTCMLKVYWLQMCG